MPEIKTKSNRSKILLAILLVILAIAIVPGYIKFRNLRLALDHCESVIRPLIYQHPQFHEVEAKDYTGGWGEIQVYGLVENKKDLEQLKSLIANTNPPVKILWIVRIKE